jgi:CHAT domain-containing protein/tetratricopeptide (TPR) repeat protein
MLNLSGQQLIKDFLNALNLRHLEQCQSILQAMAALAKEEPEYQAWCIYFTGVMANEVDNNWSEGERIFRSLLEQDLKPQLYGRVMTALGITYRRQGRWQAALDIYQQCLLKFDQPHQMLDRVKMWLNMAIVLDLGFTQGDFGRDSLIQAVAYCQSALTALEGVAELDEIEQWFQSSIWNSLILIYKNLQDWSEALRYCERYLTICQTLGDQHGLAAAHHNLGEVLQKQGMQKWDEARQAYLNALDIYQIFNDAYNQSDVLSNLGSLHREMGEPDIALDYFHQALALAESIRARLTTPITQASYRTTIEKLYLAPLSIHLERGEAELAFTAAERARSRVLADLLAGQEAKPQTDLPPYLLEQRADLRHLLDQAYAADKPPANLAGLEMALADLDRQIELLDPSYAGLEAVAPLTAEEVCERLPPETALLTYVPDDQDRLWILLATAAGIEARPVAKLSMSWLRDYLASCLDGPRRGGLLPKLPSGHLGQPTLFPSLYQSLIAPVLDLLQAAHTIYIVPFGPLHYLPLGALTPTVNQPPPLLAADRRVIYAPSATILFNYCHTRSASPHQSLLAVAPQDEQLQFTTGAAQAIAAQGQGTVLIEGAATRQAFLSEAGQHRLVCFLGHALFDHQHPMSSRLKLADSTLHASEMLRELRLQADLVILSACETGRSHVLRGDEILGLSRAMLYAGTPSLVVTLWPVHEIPTRLLVEKFIGDLLAEARFDPARSLAATQNWLRDLSLAEAQALLTQWRPDHHPIAEIEAHLTALWQMTHPGQTPQADSRLFAHPFFWSPYILIGERDG